MTDRVVPPPGWASPERALLAASGLVDTAWYAGQYPDIAAAGADPLAHFTDWGWREGRLPNLYFDTAWYLRPQGSPHLG